MIMRHQLESRFRNTNKNQRERLSIGANYATNSIGKDFKASIIVVTVEDRLVKSPIDQGDGKMPKNEYDIQELLQRDVYVNDTRWASSLGETPPERSKSAPAHNGGRGTMTNLCESLLNSYHYTRN